MESWFVFYTYPKAEKSVSAQLVKAGYNTYLPLQEEVRQWHDRKKRLQLPIFPNYIFVKTNAFKIYEVLKFPSIVRCIKFNDKPTRVREVEIDLIRRIERNCTNIILSNKLEKGQKVIIQGGPLSGLQGVIEECRDPRYVIIHIDSISYSLKVSLKLNKIIYATIREPEGAPS